MNISKKVNSEIIFLFTLHHLRLPRIQVVKDLIWMQDLENTL